MAGLFDRALGTPNDQALWALGSGLLGVRRGNEGRAAMGAMEAYNQAQQEQRRNKLTEAQLQEIEAQAAQRRALADELQRKARKEQELSEYVQSGGSYAPGATTMRPESMAGGPKYDVAKLIALGGPDYAQKIMGSRDWGRPEVARTIEADEGGQPVTKQFDKFGQPIGSAVPKHVAPVQVNRGSSIDFVKPQAGVSLPMGYSPSDRISLGNLDVSRQRLTLERDKAKAEGAGPKPPAGYRWSADGGSLEAIPGGPADIKATAEGQKAEARRKMAGDNAGMVLDTVREAKDLIGYSTAGAGGYMAKLPMTDARTLQGKLLTIKANLGFDRLQAMREASPTGGALGQVAVQELNSLQATVASLDQLQKPADLAAALDKIEKHYNNWLDTIDPERAKGGGGTEWSAPKVGDVVDGYRFKGGDPAKKDNWVQQ
jgi:hypothetical protein